MDFAAPLDGPQPGRPQVRAAQGLLALHLHTIELEIELESAATNRPFQPGQKGIVVGDANAIGVEQNVIDPRVVLYPFDQFKKLRM